MSLPARPLDESEKEEEESATSSARLQTVHLIVESRSVLGNRACPNARFAEAVYPREHRDSRSLTAPSRFPYQSLARQRKTTSAAADAPRSLTACLPSTPDPDAPGVLTVWFHSGKGPERQALEDQIERFNAAQDDVEARRVLIPEGGYDIQVQSAALSGDLPDVLDFDGPLLYKYVWQGHLIPVGVRS